MNCPNCGKELIDGQTICPSCGKEIGTEIDTRSQNGQIEIEVDINSPDNMKIESDASRQYTYASTDKKLYQKTWFIILLLVVFWPVGLFLMWKYTNWNKLVKIIITVICVFALISYGIGGSEKETDLQESEGATEVVNEQETETETGIVDEEEAEELKHFEKDALDNQLIEDLVSAGMTVDNIENGNIKTKCLCDIDGCYTEIIDTLDAYADYNISISINAGTTKEERDHMIDTSKKVVKVLEPSLSEDEINSFYERIISDKATIDDEQLLGGSIHMSYFPFKYGEYDGRIDIESYNYNLR